MTTPRGTDDPRWDGTDRRVPSRTLEALIIQLDDNLRHDMKEAHNRLRMSIDEVSGAFRAFQASQEPRLRSVEDDLMILQTERRMEDRQHAKQATFISIFVSACMAGVVQVLKTWFTGKP